MIKDLIEKEPKVLVISNNSFSKTSNNGKTLASFFKSFDANNVAQLYFNSELPTDDYFHQFYQITDRSLIKSIIFPGEKIGKIVDVVENSNVSYESRFIYIIKIVKKMLQSSNLVRLIREIVWKKSKWNTEELIEWLDNFSPEIIFFCAGDSEFAYRISNTLKKVFNTKLVIYVTDDYVLPRKTINILWWARRNRILNNMKSTLESCDLFITISLKMSNAYSEFLSKTSIVLLNMTGSLKMDLNENVTEDSNNIINLVYAGGLHLNRDKTLKLLANAISKHNMSLQSDEKQAFLKIYSSSNPSKKVIKNLEIEGACKFFGSLDTNELKEVLNKCDIPVHVESFDKKSMESTLFSVSTKIPEYLSLEKSILAIGPKEVASMEYLADVAFCINNSKDVDQGIKLLFKDQKLRKNLSILSYNKYHENHDLNKNTYFFREEIMRLHDKS